VGILNAILVGAFAGKVASCLIDLGVDINKFPPDLKEFLHIVEVEKRKEMSPQEAASYFFGMTFSDIPRYCYLIPVNDLLLAIRGCEIMRGWFRKGKMSLEIYSFIQYTLQEKYSEDLRIINESAIFPKM